MKFGFIVGLLYMVILCFGFVNVFGVIKIKVIVVVFLRNVLIFIGCIG